MSGLYSFARVVNAVLQHTLIPTRYIHPERLNDRDAPYIVISNHQSLIDPMVVAAPIKRYEVVFLGKKEITKNRFMRWLVTKMHMISVDRGHADMEAMRACMKTVRGGGILAVFPEGTRKCEGVMEHIESGVSLIALRAGVPLIPVYVRGKYAFFHRVRVYVGEPIPLDDLREAGVNADTAGMLNERIRETYRTMVREADQARERG
ncbi:MAG: 1-acyl-sn-glycerol-3-phosphate acyltransferase [Clostridia bacterium]|nr:1-acyl-sn-glycerol-3-phosphate acyltransferase [Clostridia bacterium]